MLINKRALELIKKEVLSDLKRLVEKIDIDELSVFNRGYLGYRNNPYKALILNNLVAGIKLLIFMLFGEAIIVRGFLILGHSFPIILLF